MNISLRNGPSNRLVSNKGKTKWVLMEAAVCSLIVAREWCIVSGNGGRELGWRGGHCSQCMGEGRE